jgi:hypothetical protein
MMMTPEQETFVDELTAAGDREVVALIEIDDNPPADGLGPALLVRYRDLLVGMIVTPTTGHLHIDTTSLRGTESRFSSLTWEVSPLPPI